MLNWLLATLILPKTTINLKFAAMQSILFRSLFFVLALPTLVSAQSVSADALRSDLTFLQKALYKGHPGVFRYTSRDSMDMLFNHLRAEVTTDSATADQAQRLIRQAVAAVRDGHTSVQSPFFNDQTRVMPLNAQVVGGEVFVWRNYSGDTTLKRGSEILSVNGVSAVDCLGRCRSVIFGDGFNTTFADQIASVYFARYVRLFEGDTALYSMESLDPQGLPHSHQLTSKSRAELQKLQETRIRETRRQPLPPRQAPIMFHRTMSLRRDTALPDVAVLTLGSFPNQGYRRFYREVFRWLHQQRIGTLVVDVRNNTGGNIRNMDRLVASITDEPFGYDYLRQRHTGMGRYFGPTARFTKALVWVKYNFQPGFRFRREGGMRVQRWRVKPRRQHNFNGKTFVLTNGWSFSSASMCASFLKNRAGARVVGTESGGAEWGNCGGGFPKLKLPNTGYKVRFPLFLLRYSVGRPDTGRGVMPDISTPYGIQDLLNGKDLEMEAIRRVLRQELNQK